MNRCNLCNAKELPSWHFRHRGILGGYRRSPATFGEALLTLFQWHNESINIWSHYIAGILIFIRCITITNYGKLLFLSHAKTLDIMIVFLTFISTIVTMFASAITHHFYFMNRTCHKYCWFLDFIGILSGMLIGGSNFLYFAFYCKKDIAIVTIVALVFGFVFAYRECWRAYSNRVSKYLLKPNDRFPEFSYFLSKYAVFASIGPVLITAYFHREYIIVDAYRDILLRSLLGPTLSTIGIVLFAQGGFPERYIYIFGVKEGFFDFIGHSHQWWHIMAAISVYSWIDVGFLHFATRTNEADACGHISWT